MKGVEGISPSFLNRNATASIYCNVTISILQRCKYMWMIEKIDTSRDR